MKNLIPLNNRPPQPPGSAGVSPASRKPKTGTRRRDAGAPRTRVPVQGFNARLFFSAIPKSGAEDARSPNASRLLDATVPREAFGLRAIYHRLGNRGSRGGRL
jgi:hypothetical protein